MSELRRTPLFEAHQRAGARFVPFAGYEMPVSYQGVLDEHRAVRGAAGLFDVSHMGELEVRGPGAERFLQWLTPNDLTKLELGQAQLSALLDEQGGMLDDMLVYRIAPERFLLVVNAGTRALDWEWIARWAEDFEGVELEDRSDATALLALQGPLAETILGRVSAVATHDLRYYRCVEGEVAGLAALVSRTGYTGEDGFELYVAAEDAAQLWERLLEAGVDLGLMPVGLGARDTLRLEAGMLLSGQDFDRTTTPLEVGVGWMVKMHKGDFLGRAALLRQQEAGPTRRLVGFECAGRIIARHGHGVAVASSAAAGAASGGAITGTVTSGTYSPSLERPIGLARLEGPAGFEVLPGAELELDVRGRSVEGRVVRLPFYRRG
jgi:aminomethyltransferase